MSFAQGAPTQPLVLQGSNVFLYGSSTAGNAFTVQQLGVGNVASFHTSTNATALIINPAGNVGIGVTNPAGRFSVVTSGDANIGSSLPVWTSAYMTVGQAAGTTSSCVALGYNATSNFGILYSLTPTLAWREMKYHAAYHSFHMASDTPHVTINSTGIGIGTVSPSKILHCYVAAGANEIRLESTAVTIGMGINSGNNFGFIYNRTNSPLVFGTNDSEKMRITESGNVGIGIAVPIRTLHLNGGEFSMTPSSTNAYLNISDSLGSNGGNYTLIIRGIGTAGSAEVNMFAFNVKATTSTFNGAVSAVTGYTRTTGSTATAFNAPGTGLASTDYNYILAGANDTANRLVVFVNGSARTADGGVSNVTIRNDAGSLFLGQGANPTVILGSFVGIGTSTAFNSAFKQSIYGGDSSQTLYGPNATWGAYLNIGAGTTYGAAGRASVNVSNGNLHIDCATGAFQIYLNYFQGGGSGGVNASTGCYGAFFATGDITAFSSDERLKTKVGLIENALDKVCSLTAFKYTHNEIARQNGFTDDNVYVGLSAQEVQKVLPEVVKPAPFDQGTEYDVGLGKSRSGENYLTVQYERIVSLLVEALKEERAERLKVDESLRATNERLARLEKLLLKE